MIQWFSKNDKKMIATIYPSNITINKPGLEKINHAYACMVGLDKENKKIAIKPLSKSEYDSGYYPKDQLLILSGGSTYTRISSTDFVSSVSELLSYDFNNGNKKYSCEFSSDDMIMIDLTKEVQ